MTHTTREEQVRGAIGGVVIALAAVIAIFAFASLSQAQTPSTNVGTTTVNNGADSVIGTGTTTNGTDGSLAPGTLFSATTTNATTTPGTPGVAGTTTANGTATGTQGVAGGVANVLGLTLAPLITAEPLSAPMPMIINISNDGSALIRGVVQSVGTSSLTISSWGGTWTVRVTADTVITPARLSGIMPGDFVGALGVMSATETFTVNAAVLRDWTTAPPAGQSVSPRIQAPVNGAGGAGTGPTNSLTPALNTGGQTTAPTTSPVQPGTTTNQNGSLLY